MSQLFHPLTNVVSRATIFGALLAAAGALGLIYMITTSDYATQAYVVRTQPVDFSHEHHVSGLGLDCRYCHTSVENSPFAGIPATEICMNCHSQIWSDSPKLAPVRESFATNKPLKWTRVTDVPDFVHFDHSIHVAKGMGCVVCHGRIDKMPLTWRTSSLHMRWCLDCHRSPEEHIRPRSDVFRLASETPDDKGQQVLIEKYQVRNPTTCSACHY
ncbi:MAG: cytochrome c3 family protein [Planctomycetaceae bacterium]|nr:cytochrome c3 family protein [Planctomycetaceae bacterium]